MIGQGRPSIVIRFALPQSTGAPRSRCALASFTKIAAVALLLAAWCGFIRPLCAAPTVHLRIAWGGSAEKSRQWQGTISIDRGKIEIERPLGMEADVPGSIWMEGDALAIRQPSSRLYDGVDVIVTAPLDAAFNIDFRDMQDPAGVAVQASAPLGEIVGKPGEGGRPFVKELDHEKNRLLIRRMPGDMLRVPIDRDHLVFAPGEAFKLTVEPRHLPAAVGTGLTLRARLISPGGGKEWSTQEQSFKTTPEESLPAEIPLDFKVPSVEGVYDIVLEALEPPALRFNKAKQIAERHVQIVVVSDARQPAPAPGGAWSQVMEIDPANPRWFDRIKPLAMIPGLSQAALSSADLQTTQHALGTFVQLAAAGANPAAAANPDPQWQAYPLSISHPGAPHIVEVEYPADVPQTLGVSIVEPNAAGWVLPVELDSGVYTVEQSPPGAPHIAKHRLIFWPRTKTPVLLITNRRDGGRAVFGKIHVLAGPAKLPRAAFVNSFLPERLIAGCSARPLVPENFGAAETLDSWSGRSLEDWQTFYDGASRLAEYLNYVGYGGQMLSVMADGSTIYPSPLLEPTSRYDSGMFFELAQDPLRKDGLELALRLFDREGLKLIPTLQFAAPLPELENRLRQANQDSTGIELIGPDGKSYTAANAPKRGLGPYYNPLNEEVQEAILNVVRELVQRYHVGSQHQSFGGVALELTADGYLQLPGIQWGLDDDTIARFQRATGIQVPGEGPTRFAERAKFLCTVERNATPQRTAWLNWRAEALSKFYRRIQSELAAARRDAVLYLAPTNLFDGSDATTMLRPALPSAVQLDDVLLTMGIRPESFRDQRGLVLLRPQRLMPPGPLAAQGADMEVNRTAQLDTTLRNSSSTGALFYHEPQIKRLASFDAKNPFDKSKSSLWMISQMSPSERQNRQRFVHALAVLDPDAMFDGGWLLPLGQEDSLVDFVAAYRRLPAGKFETSSEPTQPVTIRTLSAFNSTYAYLVNDSQWPVTVELQLDASQGCRIEELSGRRAPPPIVNSTWTVALQPFDLFAVRFVAPNVKVVHAETTFDPKLKAFVEQQVADFQQRVAALARPPELPPITNNSFELPAKAGQIPGWKITSVGGGTASIVPETPGPFPKPKGKQSVLLEGSAKPNATTTLTSDPFPAPNTGRLSISVWFHVEDAKVQPTMNFALKYRDGQVDRCPGALFDAQGGYKFTRDWSCYVLPFNDLPPGVGKAQVQFELTGPGRVWIDDIQLKDLAFTPDEQVQLIKIVAAAARPLEQGKLGDCLGALDNYSYWLRFLTTYVPLPAQQQIAGQQQPGAAQPQAGAQNSPPPKPPEKSANRPLDWIRGLK